MTSENLATALFEEYVARRDTGELVDELDLCQRAGACAEELRERIDAWKELRDMRVTLETTPAHEVEAASRALADAAPRKPPSELGRFRVLRELGKGGSSSVLLAEDPQLSRIVALKKLSPSLVLTATQRSLVVNEARSLAKLDHVGVVKVYEIAQAADTDLLVMEYVEGPSLSDVLDAMREARAPEQALELAPASGAPPRAKASLAAREAALALHAYSARARLSRRIAAAVAYCHDCGVLHRDLKPANILLRLAAGADPQPVLIDFGLAHVAEAIDAGVGITMQLVGTAAYVAPEQVESGRTGTDPRSDQYTIAVIAYELLTLWNPFQRETNSLTLDRVTRAQPPPLREIDPRIPRELELIVQKALQREPSRRYDSVDLFAEDLGAHLSHRPLIARSAGPLELAGLWLQRHRVAVLWGAGALLLTGVLMVLQQLHSVSRDADEIERLREALPRGPSVEPELARRRAQELLVLNDRAHDLDRRLFGGFAARDALEWIDREIDASREALRAQLTQEVELARGDPVELEGFRPRWIRWMFALAFDDRLPKRTDSPSLQSFWERGTIAVAGPPDTSVTWYRHSSAEQDSPWYRPKPIPTSSGIGLGAHRFEARGADGVLVAQRDFDNFGDYLRPHEAVTLRPPRAELLASMAQLDADAILRAITTRPESKAVIPAGVERTAKLWIAHRVACWGDLDEFLAAHPNFFSVSERPVDALRRDRPARLSREETLEVCAWYGMRLPTAAELDCALLTAGAQRPEPSRTGEWLGGQGSPGLGNRLMRRYPREDPEVRSAPPRSEVSQVDALLFAGPAGGDAVSNDRYDFGLCFRFAWGEGVGVQR